MNEKIQVILVDDHAMVRAGIRQFLERSERIEVVGEADDGVAAQMLINREIPDVVLVDVKMPRMGGIDLSRWIREHYADMKVLVLSAYDDDPYVVTAIQAGANGYALKNTSPLKLIHAVETVHAGESSLDPAIATKVMNYMMNAGQEPSPTALSEREIEVLHEAAHGHTNMEIGSKLNISARTVQGHLRKIFDKLGVYSRTEAVTKAISLNLITLEVD
ncbi:response regulator transcription factor [Chloroflexi bacterium TSY]|nr:response regulator transcription factor [Chloroflexi bacterium TSY]